MYKTQTPWTKHMLLAWMIYRFVIISMPVALAHSDNGNYSSDIPESLMWLLSFFLLIGLLFVVGSYFLFPDPVTQSSCSGGVTYVRIDPSDIRKLGDLLRNSRKDEDDSV